MYVLTQETDSQGSNVLGVYSSFENAEYALYEFKRGVESQGFKVDGFMIYNLQVDDRAYDQLDHISVEYRD